MLQHFLSHSFMVGFQNTAFHSNPAQGVVQDICLIMVATTMVMAMATDHGDVLLQSLVKITE